MWMADGIFSNCCFLSSLANRSLETAYRKTVEDNEFSKRPFEYNRNENNKTKKKKDEEIKMRGNECKGRTVTTIVIHLLDFKHKI